MLRLKFLINSLEGHEFLQQNSKGKLVKSKEFRKLYLWCDTICCPVDDLSYKNLAIGKLAEVYTKAGYVLVLDCSLERFLYADVGVLEASTRLVTSR